ncbi:hypothetical protein Tco_1079046 [Tanacetum coccineum]|uniref:Reverse transcriptase domain-containing protein n=1 Tax=Tanacetum coccineum TaxID=301880 RepID=A0ABQ5HQQ4_9ASTR
MHTHASNSELVEPLPEPERTLNQRLRRRYRRVTFKQRNEPPAQPKFIYAPILDINYFCHFLDILENYNPMDDEPMWAADHVVALTPCSAITITETTNEFAIKDFPPPLFDQLLGEIRAFSQHENETLTEVWLLMNKMLKTCHGYNLSKGNIIKPFYHSLNETTQEVLNATACGIFLYKTPNQAYQLLEEKVLVKLDWAKNQKTKSSLKKTISFADEGSSNSDTDKIMTRMDSMTMKMDAQYKEFQSCSKQPNPDHNDDDKPMSPEEEAKFMQTFRRTCFYNDYCDRDSNCDNWRSSERNVYNRDNYQFNSDDKPDLQKQLSDFIKAQYSTNSFFKDTFMDLKIKLETTTKNHQASIQNLEAKFDIFADKQSIRTSGSLPSNTQPNPKGSSSKPYQPSQAQNKHVNVVFTRSGKSYNPPINPNDQPNNSETPVNFDSDDEYKEPTPQPKHKFKQISSAFLSDESSVMIQNKVPPKLGDPKSFLIPCNFSKAFSCNALADLGASINLIIDVIDEILEEDFDALLDEGSKILHSIEGTILEEKLFAEFDEFIAMIANENSESDSDTKEPPFEKITVNTDYKIKTSLQEPPSDLELKPLPDNLEYVFWENLFSSSNHIILAF